jgi:alpha-1,2-mannosyltransferase
VKVRVFYSVRIFLGLISTISETVLVVALSRRYGKRLACYVLAMLCLSSGCFFVSTSMLIQRLLLCQYQVCLSSGCFFASFLLLFGNYIADVWLLQLGATLIIFILYSRFLARFILHVCSNTFVCTLPS